MKMHRQDFRAMRESIERRFSASDLANFWVHYVAQGWSAKRFRWDMLHASGFNTKGLYDAGLNDDHIDTALRSIIPTKDA
jgi:hypothetical protein